MSVIQILPREKCTGCGACRIVCPVHVIAMETDREGFRYPEVSSGCTDCGLCRKACPQLSLPSLSRPESGAHAIGLDADRIRRSASGGVFAVLADYMISELRGVVFGACLDADFAVRHHAAERTEEIRPMQGSKYVQSDVGDTYARVRDFLKSGRYVLYSGTPCQIAGLRRYLRESNTDRLVTLDLICHGVAAPAAFQKYCRYLGHKRGRELIGYRFRNRTGYDRSGYISRLEYSDGKVVWKASGEDVFFAEYLSGTVFRKACYACPFARPERIGDLTCGDCNTYRKDEGFHPWEATSCLLINTKKGAWLWGKTGCLFHSMPLDVEAEIRANGQLNHAFAMPSARDGITLQFGSGDFEAVEEQRGKTSTARTRARNWVRTHIPLKMRKKLTGLFQKRIPE